MPAKACAPPSCPNFPTSRQARSSPHSQYSIVCFWWSVFASSRKKQSAKLVRLDDDFVFASEKCGGKQPQRLDAGRRLSETSSDSCWRAEGEGRDHICT